MRIVLGFCYGGDSLVMLHAVNAVMVSVAVCSYRRDVQIDDFLVGVAH